jgi:hypothetical protein
MSDILSTLTESDLANQIVELIKNREANGNHTTVSIAARKLNVKAKEVSDNVPTGYKLLPSSNGDHGGQRFAEKTAADDELAEAITLPANSNIEEVEVVQQMKPRKDKRVKVETEKVVKEPTYQLDEEGNQVLDEAGNPIPVVEESGPTVICAICGNPVRKSSIVRRGICPLCFRQLAKNLSTTAPKLEALSDEEFEIVLGDELGRREALKDYKTSRTLTAEEFKEREADLVPVKEVFAAGKEAGYGPGRVAQAMGGDRFRHEPLGGFGSVWTPYFYGPRSAWYFDKSILESFSELAKPVKEKKVKVRARLQVAQVLVEPR